MSGAQKSEYWERRGCQIYTEGEFRRGHYVPGSARLIADHHGKLEPTDVQAIVDEHNSHLTDN